MNKTLIGILISFVLAQTSSAGTLVYGNPVVARSVTENATGAMTNTLFLLNNDVVDLNGRATTWSVYSSNGSGGGTVASVILSPQGGGLYDITGVSRVNLYQDGVNTFTWSPTWGSSSIRVGSIFGLWFGTGGVDRPCINGAGCGNDNSLYTNQDRVNWYNSTVNTYAPYAGFTNGIGLYPPASLNGNQSNPLNPVYVNQLQSRVYSYQVNADVPEPSTLALMGTVVFGWTAKRKRT